MTAGTGRSPELTSRMTFGLLLLRTAIAAGFECMRDRIGM